MERRVRVGAVNYLNTKPLICDLERIGEACQPASDDEEARLFAFHVLSPPVTGLVREIADIKAGT